MTHDLSTHLQKITHPMLLPAVGYFDMLALLGSCSLVLSDSGGLREEVTAPGIGKSCIVLRTSTEHPEAIEVGHARVMGFEAICAEIEARAGKGRPSQEHPYGTGDAARKIVDALEDFLGRQPPSS